MDAKQRIELAKINLGKAERTKTVKETQLDAAKKQKEEVLTNMAAEGVTPETIETTIAVLKSEIDDGLTKIEGLMPKVE